MSPGSQIRALTANKAIPKRKTIAIGKMVVRKKLNLKKVFKHVDVTVKFKT